MKIPAKPASSVKQSMGDWAKGFSIMLLVAALVACVLDVFLVSRGELTVPYWGYLIVIGAGVALHLIGHAIPNMTSDRRAEKPARPDSLFRIDD